MESGAQVEGLKKVEPAQTLTRVLLMAIGDDGTPTPVQVSAANGNQIGGSSGGSSSDAVTSASTLTDNAIVRGDGGGHGVQTSGILIDDSNNVTGLLTIDVPNVGLKLRDTDASNVLIVKPGSNLTANRTLTVTTGDSDRTLTMAGDASITGTNTGDQTITLTGDVTGSGTSSFAATIGNDKVTLAKLQNAVANSRLLGSGSAGAGSDYAEISLAGTLAMTGTTLSASIGKNMVINPEFSFTQRATLFLPATDNAYTQDRWRCLMESAASCNVARQNGSGTWQNQTSFTATATNNKKFGLFQPIESVNMARARGQTVTLSAQLKCDATISDVRMAILQWTSTADAVSATPISAWGTTGNPTLTTWTYANTPANLSVTSSFVQYSVSASISSTATNLGVFIWNNDQTTTSGDGIQASQVQLEVGAAFTVFDNRLSQQEISLCQRYYTKSYELDVAPATALVRGFVCMKGASTSAAVVYSDFPVPMRTTPTIVLYSFSPATANKIFNLLAGTSIGTTVTSAGTASLRRFDAVSDSGSGLTAGNDYGAHFTADAEL